MSITSAEVEALDAKLSYLVKSLVTIQLSVEKLQASVDQLAARQTPAPLPYVPESTNTQDTPLLRSPFADDEEEETPRTPSKRSQHYATLSQEPFGEEN